MCRAVLDAAHGVKLVDWELRDIGLGPTRLNSSGHAGCCPAWHHQAAGQHCGEIGTFAGTDRPGRISRAILEITLETDITGRCVKSATAPTVTCADLLHHTSAHGDHRCRLDGRRRYVGRAVPSSISTAIRRSITQTNAMV